MNEARRLWGEGQEKGFISTSLGIGINVVSDCVKGIMRAKSPPGSRVDVPGMLYRAGIPVIESPAGKGTSIETSTLKVAQPRIVLSLGDTGRFLRVAKNRDTAR